MQRCRWRRRARYQSDVRIDRGDAAADGVTGPLFETYKPGLQVQYTLNIASHRIAASFCPVSM